MKTVKIFATALLSGLMLFSSVSAKPGKGSSFSGDQVRDQIVNALSDIAVTGQEVVIKFAANGNKGFELLNVEGTDVKVVEAVKSELAGEKISVPSDMSGVYSLKVRFGENTTAGYNAADVLRNQIADVLSNVSAPEFASVKLAFTVTDSKVTIKKVESANTSLAASIEKALAASQIVAPAELAGNYSVVVKF